MCFPMQLTAGLLLQYSADVTYARKQCTLKYEYLTLKHIVEQLMSSAHEWTKGAFMVKIILNNQCLAVVLCILS